MKILRDEKGQTLVLTALCMTAMLGFLALSMDVGVLFRSRRCIQNAADAAAVAAAQDYMWNQLVSSAQTAGKNASSTNGYTDGTAGVTVTINLPPTSGPNTGASGFAEAIVSMPVATPFMGVFFSRRTVSVQGRAVAATPNNGSACIWLMGSSGTDLDIQGSYDIEAPGCGIYVNSPSNNALKVTGNGGTVNAAFLDVVGNNSGNHTTAPTADTLNAGTRSTPWGNLTGPSYPGGCTHTFSQGEITLGTDNTTQVSETTINGYFTTSSTNTVICFSNSNVTVDSGVVLNGADTGVVYLFEGSVNIPTSATVQFGNGSFSPNPCTTNCTFSNEEGATVDLAGSTSTINQASNGLLSIYSPASQASTYDGIAILQPATNTTELQIQFGSSNQVLDGYIYAPGAEVFMQDSGGGVTASGIVAKSMYEKTSQLYIPTNYDTSHSSTTKNRQLVLVE